MGFFPTNFSGVSIYQTSYRECFFPQTSRFESEIDTPKLLTAMNGYNANKL